MDPALLRERDAFRKRALALPTVEKRKHKHAHASESSRKKKKPSSPKSQVVASSRPTELNYKYLKASSKYKFGILAKIVNHMKVRHQRGDTYALTIDEILDETNQLDVGLKQKHWLITEALCNNPKIQVSESNKYSFKPKYNLRGRKDLLRLLDRHDQKGLGGILLEDIQESLPMAEKAVKILGDQIIIVVRPVDKKKILFYNDKSCQFTVDEDFQKLWRSIAVDSLDEGKIEEYLKKQGITSMQDIGGKKIQVQKRRKPSRKGMKFKKHNDHMGDVLKDYSEN
ncbi:general transcription factor IIE subunit 2-like [Saccoglossus kowalevskii]|uniref:Transcription initiation factor IIE subunit beta n=1 Tax=Saccoglossus kowalevskii TaxID=10224 RepID=A0ABM0MT67_SACKO|nr:PREDICTED: general transcription factor IIE subunit 2-like [Saccoglossus kowalevskii]